MIQTQNTNYYVATPLGNGQMTWLAARISSDDFLPSWHGGWKLVIRMVCVGVWVEIADLTRTFILKNLSQ